MLDDDQRGQGDEGKEKQRQGHVGSRRR